MGDLGFYSELSTMAFDLILGTILDVFGRKIPTITGFLIASICIMGMPMGTKVYPTLLILK